MVTTLSDPYPYCIKSYLVGISTLEESIPFTMCKIGKDLSVVEPQVDTMWLTLGVN